MDTHQSTWLAHGATDQGFLLLPDHPDQHVRSKVPSSVATHRGQVWLIWTDFDDVTYYAATTPESHGEVFGPRQKFPTTSLVSQGDAAIPVIANLNGVLHAIIVSSATGYMRHFIYDESDQDEAWLPQDDALPASCVAGRETRDPALVAFHNKLFLAYVAADGSLWSVAWDIHSQVWGTPSSVSSTAAATSAVARTTFRGAPALFVLNGALHLLCESTADDAEIVGFRYDYTESGWTWSPTDDVSEGRAARGVSAASFGGQAYLGFIEHDGVFVAGHRDGEAWSAPERVGGAHVKARFPPQITVLNGRVHCLFAGKWKGDLHWFSRPVLGYDLKTWMGSVADDTWLSGMTIPGTHDSCARSNVPFVRTQYLSITQQLALGIRFLDLRLRRHDDGKLYCYHGGMPIGLPRGLSFAQVMDEVWDFIGPKNNNIGDEGKAKQATETVLISINNDNRSKEQKKHPEMFYNAVKEAIEGTPPYEQDWSARWYTAPVTAKLGDVRGKAVLLRRYAGDPGVAPTARMGLDLHAWLDDNPDFTILTPNSVRVRLQDKWKYARRCALDELVASKQAFVRTMLARAAGLQPDEPSVGAGAGWDEDDGDDNEENTIVVPPVPVTDEIWFLNFCSAVGDPVEHGEVAEAKWIAVGAHSDLHWFGSWVEGMNVRTRDYLRRLGGSSEEGSKRQRRRYRLGVVNLDYPELPEDSDLVARLIETNFGAAA